MVVGPLCSSRSQPSVPANGRRPIKKIWAVGVCTAAISLAGGAVSTTDNDVSTTDNDVWANRVHCALGGLESMNIDADRITLLQAVAARFASRFDPDDRLYEGGEPQWHHRVDEAVDRS